MDSENKHLYAYFPMLDGVRAISIIWVILRHIPVDFPPFIRMFQIRGVLGVEVFFAVSGFLVTRSLYQCIKRNPKPKSYIYDYFIRRLSRIIPGYYFLLVFIFMTGFLFKYSLKEKILGISDILWSFPAYLFNYFYFFTDNQKVPGTLIVLWSLSFEEQFYVLLLLVFVFFSKWRKQALWGLLLMSIATRLAHAGFYPEDLTYKKLQFYTHLRLDSVMWGCLGWVYFEQIHSFWDKIKLHNRLIGHILLSCVIAVSIVFNYPDKFIPMWDAITYIFTGFFYTAFCIYLCLDKDSIFARILSNKYFVKVGIISYELYLLHMIVIGLCVSLKVTDPTIFSILTYIGTGIIAILFHSFFTKPVQVKIRDILKTSKSIR